MTLTKICLHTDSSLQDRDEICNSLHNSNMPILQRLRSDRMLTMFQRFSYKPTAQQERNALADMHKGKRQANSVLIRIRYKVSPRNNIAAVQDVLLFREQLRYAWEHARDLGNMRRNQGRFCWQYERVSEPNFMWQMISPFCAFQRTSVHKVVNISHEGM